MRRVKQVALACTAITALSGAAIAADLPLKARPLITPVANVFSWNGLYVGLHAGVAFNDDFASFQRTTGGTVLHPLQEGSDSAAFVGVQVGYNRQFGQWLAGIEADLSLRPDDDLTLSEGPITFYVKSDHLFGTVRGRLGWLWMNDLLIYATGGWAFREGYSAVATGPGPVGVFDLSRDWQSGWVVGGGLEKRINASWTAKLEYQYLNFSNDTTVIQFNPGAKGNRGTFTVNGETHTARMGVNYRFWGM